MTTTVTETTTARPRWSWRRNPYQSDVFRTLPARYLWDGKVAVFVYSWHHDAHDECPGFGKVWDWGILYNATEARLDKALARECSDWRNEGGVQWSTPEFPRMRRAQVEAEVAFEAARAAVSA